MAIPMAAIIQLLFDRFFVNPVALESEVTAGRDYAAGCVMKRNTWRKTCENSRG